VLGGLVFLGGLALGHLVGRWWALVAPAALGVWVAIESEVEVNPTVLGLAYALIGGAGVALGVALRRVRERRKDR
jgi:hypothetical protein